MGGCHGGTVYDGRGGPPQVADLAISGDRIAAVGDLADATAATVVDARGLAVAPGFINMLSWATESLLVDDLDLEVEAGCGGPNAHAHSTAKTDALVRLDAQGAEIGRFGFTGVVCLHANSARTGGGERSGPLSKRSLFP